MVTKMIILLRLFKVKNKKMTTTHHLGLLYGLRRILRKIQNSKVTNPP